MKANERYRKAVEFVKKFGWEKSKSILINAHHKATHFYCGWMELVDYFYKHENLGWCKVDSRTTGWDSDRCCYDVHPPISSMFVIEELKRLVNSYKVVERCGGLEKAKLRCYLGKHLSLVSYCRLKQAIEDVERCK